MRRSVGLAWFIAWIVVLAACSDAPVEVPEALRGVCTAERGCQFTEEVVEALCNELGQPERIELDTRDHEVRLIATYQNYPVTPSGRGYPIAVPNGTPLNWAIDCTVR